MHRRFIACILVALIAQASAVEAQQTLLENFPSYSQDDTGWCAWVSAQMVLKYYGYSVPPQKVAVKTFELANEKWGLDAVKADKNGLNSDRIPDYENAIIALSDNSLEIEEITARDKDELLYEIFDSIDSGRPIIVLSTAPWLYEVYGGKYPDGAHASVIAGYSLDFETNENLADHPFDLYPGVLASLVSSPPALRLYDPATAALGEGAYWLSYEHFFDETTSSEEFLTLIVVNKGSNEDTNFPKVQAFTVSSNAINSGATFTIDYAVSDNGGSGLAQVELWRKDETSDWQEIKRNSLAGENGPISGSFRDSPSASGKYWYGVHVVDNAGNWNDERNSNTDHQPTSFEPIEVEVIVSGLQSTTLNPPTTPTAIIIAEDIKMGDNNGRSKIEYRQDFIIEHVLTNTYLVFADVSGVEGLDEWNWYSYNDVFLNGAYLTTMNDITDSGLKIKIDESLLTMGVNTIVIRSGLTDRNKEPFDDFSIGRIILVGEITETDTEDAYLQESGLQSTTLNPPTTPTAIIMAEDIKMGDNNGRSKIEYRQDFIIEHVLTNTYLVFADVSGVEGLDEWNWYSYNDVFLNGAYLTTMNDITDSGLKIKIDESLLTMGVNTIVIRSGLTDRNKEPFDDFSIGRIILVGENISVVTL